jgi:hypothetical protein
MCTLMPLMAMGVSVDVDAAGLLLDNLLPLFGRWGCWTPVVVKAVTTAPWNDSSNATRRNTAVIILSR